MAQSIGEIEISARLSTGARPVADDAGAALWWLSYVKRYADERAAERVRNTRYADGWGIAPAPFAFAEAEFVPVVVAAAMASRIFGSAESLHLSEDERDLEMLAETGWLGWLLAA